jgi:glutamine synthetase
MPDEPAPPERLIFAATCDFAGHVRGKAFPAADSEYRTRAGVGYTGSNIMMSAFGPIYSTPFGTVGDIALVPDLSTLVAIPAADGLLDLALGDIRNLDGTPWSCCPREFLRRGLAALDAEFGYQVFAAFEQEFVYTGVAERPASTYAFDMYRRAGNFGGRVFGALRAGGVIPDSFLPEYGPRQFEVTVKPSVGVRAADDAVIAREVLRACAAHDGSRAILAPVIEPDGIGNGTHVHFSLLDGSGRAVMYDPAEPLGISAAAAPFLAGVLAHLPALTALTAPSVASFFRLRPNKWAPTYANLGERDRGAALRICPIFAGNGDDEARTFNAEYRVADAAGSPYLQLGALVHAGLDGLRRRLPLPAHPQGRDADFAAAGIPPLPHDLASALDLLEATPAARDWCGSEFLAAYLELKRAEIAALSGLDDLDVCRRYAEVY